MTTLRIFSATVLFSGLALAALPRARAQSVYTYPYTTAALAGTVRSPGSVDGNPGKFQLPEGIAVDASGNVYVGDTSDETVREVSPAGSITTIAGQHTVQGATNGTGAAAQFNGPEGVAIDSQGNLYVADVTNDEIRKIAPGGAVTTLAGAAGVAGSVDGTGSSANFSNPAAVAVDAEGNVYVADTYNDTIRKVTPAGVVTTIAGSAGITGSVDGTGSGARFYYPAGVAVDGAGNIYVADTHNDTIRKITSAGVVTTIAGSAGISGSTDGAGTAARFDSPIGIALDAGGNIYVADTGNDTIRIVSSSNGTVSTLAGSPGVTGTALGTGSSAQFYAPYGVAVDTNGNIYVADTLNTVVRKGASSAVPVITAQPQGQTVTAGGSASFSVTATGALAYQWYLNGSAIPGATSATLSLSEIGTNQAGSYTVGASNGAGTATSSAATLTVNYTARLMNLSARAYVGTGNDVLIAGFDVAGAGTKNMLVRADGPSLANNGVPSGYLPASILTLYDGSSKVIDTDTDWGNAPVAGNSSVSVSAEMATAAFMQSLGAFPYAQGSLDSAMETAATPTGLYTAEVSGQGGVTGVGLAELYDADNESAPTRLANISARAYVSTGSDVLIGGFEVSGSTPETLLIRGVGPGLSAINVDSGTLPAPVLTLYDSSGDVIATNIGWGNAPTPGNSSVQAGIQLATSAVFTEVGAFSLPADSPDCAMIAVLPPGLYTVIVSGVGGTTGIGLVEIYEVP